MATLLTLNLTKKMLALHKGRRRKMASYYVKREVARLNKAELGDVKLSSALNRHIMATLAKSPRKISLSVDKVGNNLKVDLYKKAVPQQQQDGPDVKKPGKEKQPGEAEKKEKDAKKK